MESTFGRRNQEIFGLNELRFKGADLALSDVCSILFHVKQGQRLYSSVAFFVYVALGWLGFGTAIQSEIS
ncbi:hypothetical protein FBY51_0764 [Zymomonas mobilis]|nr:hypothetical protein ZZ6_1083 [Zymomonas mobilis subsp. mobilis ATCC 29191]TQK77592.1 hypothetical protein FBY53_0221 [Zymomonas mobilis]TQL15757.1 hypothetical protein FBY51_0764 [Zymomonas mobilis]GEB88261.1 hypothetical protein ZMO01_16010 [Zymomonas mobilis subsp. mobilis]